MQNHDQSLRMNSYSSLFAFSLVFSTNLPRGKRALSFLNRVCLFFVFCFFLFLQENKHDAMIS